MKKIPPLYKKSGQFNFWLKRCLSIAFVFLQMAGFDCGSKALHRGRNQVTVEDFRKRLNNMKDISHKDMKGVDLLYAEVERRDRAKVKVILERIELDKKEGMSYEHGFPNAVHATTRLTALGLAIQKGAKDIVEDLLKCPSIDVNKAGAHVTTLALAIKEKQKKIANMLLDKPAIDVRNPKGGHTLLHLAVKANWREFVEKLLRRYEKEKDKAVFNAIDEGYTALGLAIQKGRVDMVRDLLACSYIDINKAGRTTTLALAIENKEEVIASALLAKSNIDVSNPKGNNTLLHLAVQAGWRDIVRTLLHRYDKETHIDRFNATNAAGYTALGWAIQKGKKDIVEELIKCFSVKVNKAKTDDRDTTLVMAIQGKQQAIAALLLDKLASRNLDMRTPDRLSGNTPLHLAVEYGWKEITALLLQHLEVSDVYTCNYRSKKEDTNRYTKEKEQIDIATKYRDRTALHLAARYRHKDIFESLFNKIKDDPGCKDALLQKDLNGWSVFGCSYVQNWKQALKDNLPFRDFSAMFQQILTCVAPVLDSDAWNAIRAEVDEAKKANKIDEKQAKKLQEVVQSNHSSGKPSR